MSVMRCTQCNELCISDDLTKPAKFCEKCGSDKLECDHPSSQFDKSLQCFVCSWCGKHLHDSIGTLRKFALEAPELGLQSVLDTSTH